MNLTQSKVKSFEQTTCKRKFQAEYISGEIQRQPNEYMLRGLFLEQEALGSSAHSGEKVDLPKLKDGRKSIIEIRLESQAQRFKRMFNPDSPDYIGFQITDKQLLLKDGDREGTLDFTCRRNDKPSVWDLKSCEDLTSAMGWGNPEKLDLIQQGWYRHLYQVNYGVDPELYLLIMDYSPQERCKIIKLTISDDTQAEFLRRFDTVEGTLLELEAFGEYPKIPNWHDCKKCGLSCKERAISAGVDFQEMTI